MPSHRAAAIAATAARRLFTVERVDASGETIEPRGMKAAALRLNQFLVETGRTPPWIGSPDSLRDFWATQGAGAPNAPHHYADKDTAVVDFLHRFWTPEVTREMSLLEL